MLVVCDGVSTADDSDVGGLAAARAARDVLVSTRPAGSGVPESRAAAIEAALVSRRRDGPTRPSSPARRPDAANPASCTFSAVVLEDDLCVFGNVGDSRAYWITDAGAGDPCSSRLDDSVAQLRIAAGVPKRRPRRARRRTPS